METVTLDMYNPHVLVTLKRILNTESGDVQFELYKITELEGVLDDLRRRDNLISQRIEAQEKQLGQIIAEMTEESWYNPNTDKETVLSELAEIIGYTPKKEISFTAVMHFSGRIEVDLADWEDFDLTDMLSEAYVDINNGDIVIDDYELYTADEA